MTTRATLLDRLLDPESVVVFDGAMGTMLYARGVFINQCYDELNTRAPDLVRAVHAEYARAGAEVLETNTFGANRIKLTQYGLEAHTADFNLAAARIARDVAGDTCLVAGAVGPLGVRLEPYGPTSHEEARAAFAEQMAALKEGGADLFIIETFGDLEEIGQAVRAARDVDPTMPVVAQMTIGTDGHSPFGASSEDVAAWLEGVGADVIGLNCSVGPQGILEGIERMAHVTRRKLSAQPNAGMPRDVGGRAMYMASAEYMATYARHLVQAGAKVVGGCCGTTPEHLRAMCSSLRVEKAMVEGGIREAGDGKREPGDESQATSPSRFQRPASEVAVVPFADRSRLSAKLARGEFITTVEIVPPRGVDASKLLRDAATLHAAGVDAINVPDGPRAQSRMGAIATSLVIERTGIEAVTHYCCRDRNLLGMLSDLLGASALGLRNMLLITGDPPKMGPYPDATAVFDIDAIGLTNMVNKLNHGLDLGNNPIGQPTAFCIGVGVNPGAINLDEEIRRFEYKVEAGAQYAITQPVFDTDQLRDFIKRIEHVKIPIVAGIWPLVSYRNAEFLHNEVPGVRVTPSIMDRMRAASAISKEAGRDEGLKIAGESLNEVRDIIHGVQVSAPFGNVKYALEVFGALPELAAAKVQSHPAA